MFHFRRGAALLALVPCAFLAACTHSVAGDPHSSTPSATHSASPETATPDAKQSQTHSGHADASRHDENDPLTPINGTAWVTSLDPRDAHTTDSPMVFTDLRVAEHPDFYRVVAEFSGTGRPGYYQAWPHTPVEQGRGQALSVAGSAFLEFMVTGTSMPVGELEQIAYSGPRTLKLGPLEVREDGTFEDSTHLVIGMDQEREFQVGFLDNPVRMVIDIKK